MADLDVEFEQLTMNPRRTPQWIGLRHSSNKITDLLGDSPPTRPSRPALPSPEQFESLPVPPDDGLGLDRSRRFSPVRPKSLEDDPKCSFPVRQARSFGIPLQDVELMT